MTNSTGIVPLHSVTSSPLRLFFLVAGLVFDVPIPIMNFTQRAQRFRGGLVNLILPFLVLYYLYNKNAINFTKSLRPAYALIADLEKLGIIKEITGAERGRLYLFEDYVSLFKQQGRFQVDRELRVCGLCIDLLIRLHYPFLQYTIAVECDAIAHQLGNKLDLHCHPEKFRLRAFGGGICSGSLLERDKCFNHEMLSFLSMTKLPQLSP